MLIGDYSLSLSLSPSLLPDLLRIQEMVVTRQGEIQDDIERVANEIESLDNEIRIHIARNTACLSFDVLAKKKRKRRSLQKNH